MDTLNSQKDFEAIWNLVTEAIGKVTMGNGSCLWYQWAGGAITADPNVQHCTFRGSMDEANDGKRGIRIWVADSCSMHIGPYGAFEISTSDFVSDESRAKAANAARVEEILNWVFGEIAKDLATRSLAKVAIQLREKGTGFADLKRIVDVAKSVLNK